MSPRSLVFFLNCILLNYANVEKLFIVDGQGFFVFLKSTLQFGTVKMCKVIFKKDEVHEIDMKPGSHQQIVTERGEIISPYLPNQCGFRILKISNASKGEWHVKMFNESDSEMSKKFVLQVLPKPEPKKVTHVEKNIGRGTLSCSDVAWQMSCRISNDKDLSFEKCQVELLFREPSTWYCRTLNSGTMEQSTETIHVSIKNKSNSKAGTVEETEAYFKLGCQVPNSKTGSSCIAEFPDGKSQLLISNNLYHERYSIFDTNLKKGYCALSIKKPIADKEKGIWRIYEMDKSPNAFPPKGCIVYLGNKQNLIQKTLDEEEEDVTTIEVIKSRKTNNNNFAKLYDTFSLTCKVPFLIDRCYVKDPLGVVYFQGKNTLGICDFKNLPIIHGRWICGLYGPDYPNEIIREFEVLVKPEEGEVITDQITATSGDVVDLLCRSAMAEPITTCAFTDPEGRVYWMSNNLEQSSNSHISYFGKGLQNGHCGVKIKGINRNEFGNWTCQFIAAYKKSLLNITIQESPTSLATIIGTSVGLIALLPILVIGIFLLIRRRINSQQTERVTDEISMSSQE